MIHWRVFCRVFVLVSVLCWHGVVGVAQYPAQKYVPAAIDYAIKGYFEWLPKDYDSRPGKRYPLLIFLHGLDALGDGSAAQRPRVLANGPPRWIEQGLFPTAFQVDGRSYSFIVISPQFSVNARNYGAVDTLVEALFQRYRVDSARVYLTGLSMGGGISWIYAGGKARFAARLAGLVIVCGNTKPYPANVRLLAGSGLPIWILHNTGDPKVPVTFSQQWARGLNDAGIAPPVRLTLFDSAGHDAWTKAYDPAFKEGGQNIYEWLLSHRR